MARHLQNCRRSAEKVKRNAMKQPQLTRILKRIMLTLMHLYKINEIKYKEVPYGTQ